MAMAAVMVSAATMVTPAAAALRDSEISNTACSSRTQLTHHYLGARYDGWAMVSAAAMGAGVPRDINNILPAIRGLLPFVVGSTAIVGCRVVVPVASMASGVDGLLCVGVLGGIVIHC